MHPKKGCIKTHPKDHRVVALAQLETAVDLVAVDLEAVDLLAQLALQTREEP